MKAHSLNGFGLAVIGAGVLLIWSAWRNWTIADTVRAAADLARGGSVPPAGETSGAMAYAVGRNLSDVLGNGGRKRGTNSGAGAASRRASEKNSAPGSIPTERTPI